MNEGYEGSPSPKVQTQPKVMREHETRQNSKLNKNSARAQNSTNSYVETKKLTKRYVGTNKDTKIMGEGRTNQVNTISDDATNENSFDELYQIYAHESDREISELVDSSDSEEETEVPRGCESEDDEQVSDEKCEKTDCMIADLMDIKKRWNRNRAHHLHLRKKDENAKIDAINKLRKEHAHLRQSVKNEMGKEAIDSEEKMKNVTIGCLDVHADLDEPVCGLELWSSKADETVGGPGWIHVRAVVDSGAGASVQPLSRKARRRHLAHRNRSEDLSRQGKRHIHH